ncbi:MAG TPA: hypothetical protein VMV32_01710 [Ignavibacteriaceae bacterium]|nr:hypothetical protein [Ignavibacteriaceae bacterium]
MAITVDPEAIPQDDIGGEIVLAQVDPTTYAITGFATGTTLVDIKDIALSDVVQTADKSEKKNEQGETRRVSYKYNLMTTGEIMQGDKGTLDFMASSTKDTAWLEFKKTGQVAGQDQWYVKIVNITPQLKISRGQGNTNTPYESVGIFPQTAVTYTATILATLIALLTLTDFPTAAVTIPVSEGFAIAEGAF